MYWHICTTYLNSYTLHNVFFFRDWYWRQTSFYSTNFGKFMSKDRFLQIWRNLHLNNNLDDHKDNKLYQIRPLLNTLCGTFQSTFTSNGYFTVDESMVKWKGRLAWRQFMPNKPIRFGMKVWSLCDSVTGYMFNFQIYTGKVKGKPERIFHHVWSKTCWSLSTLVLPGFVLTIFILDTSYYKTW